MKKKLSPGDRVLFHCVDGSIRHGQNPKMTGDISRLWGDCTGLSGDCSGIWGDCSYLNGDFSGIYGWCAILSGDWDAIFGITQPLVGDLNNFGIKQKHTALIPVVPGEEGDHE